MLTLVVLSLVMTSVRAAGTETLIGVVGRDFVMLGADQSVARSIVLTSTEVDKIKVISDQVVMAAAGELADVDDIYWSVKGKVALSELDADVPSDVQFVDMGSNGSSTGQDNVLPEPWTVLSVSAVAKLARNIISQRMRSRAPYKGLSLLVAGLQREVTNPQDTKNHWKSGTNTAAFFADEVRRQLKVPSSSATPEEDSSPPKDSVVGKTQLRPCLFWIDEYGALQKIQYGIHGMGASFGLALLDQGFREGLSRKEAFQLIQNCYSQLGTRYLINSPKPPLIKCVDATGCHVYDGSTET